MPSFTRGLGNEKVLDEVYFALIENLSAAIDRENELAAIEDMERSGRLEAMGLSVVTDPVVVTEHIPPSNHHVGSLPSFIQSHEREQDFPLVATTPGRSVLAVDDDSSDQYRVVENMVSIHAICKAGPEGEEHPDLAWRRAERTSEAIDDVIHTTRSLRKLLRGVSGPSLVDRSEPWKFFGNGDGHGPEFWWFATVRTYQIKNYSMPHQ